MKKFVLTLIAASVLLISVAHIGIATTDAASPQQNSPYKATNVNEKSITNPSVITGSAATAGNKDNSIRREGAIPTKIILLEPSVTVLKLHVGDRTTIHLKLIRSDTGAGIPDAAIGATVSLDGKSWYTTGGGAVVTDSNGEIGPITFIVPDPRPIANQIPLLGSLVHLPMTVYVKVTYAGDSTYAGSEPVIYEATLLP